MAGGWCWFDQVLVMDRSGLRQTIAPGKVPADILNRITAPRAPIAGLGMDQPRLMGILNVTPDSFSDGGQYRARDAAIAHGRAMVRDGADIIDIGGESTRPGAKFVPADAEIARIVPVIKEIADKTSVPVSIDTRKTDVAQAALDAGGAIINDVSALSYAPDLAQLVAQTGTPICLMHAQGDPETMQNSPSYENVLLDVYDFLEQRIELAVSAGIAREKIIVDPGIGFGKTVEHNLALLQGLGLFHALGCPVLLGASRKGFIGKIGGAPDGAARMPGSLAVTLAGIAKGVQIARVHDIAETRQAVKLWSAATGMGQ